MDLQAVAEKIRKLPGILEANAWTHVENKARIYVELKKQNRQRCWNMGAGRRLIVHATGRMEWSGVWAGAMTRNWHDQNGTWDRIKDVITEALADEVGPEISATL